MWYFNTIQITKDTYCSTEYGTVLQFICLPSHSNKLPAEAYKEKAVREENEWGKNILIPKWQHIYIFDLGTFCRKGVLGDFFFLKSWIASFPLQSSLLQLCVWKWVVGEVLWHNPWSWILLRSWDSSVNHTPPLFSADSDCCVASAVDASWWWVMISVRFVCVGLHWGYVFYTAPMTESQFGGAK